MRPLLLCAASAAAAVVVTSDCASGAGRALAQAVETPKEIIAAQLRRQGYACKNPRSAERDRELSKPDQPVWLLVCEDHVYKVRLIPKMAAKVSRIK